MTTATICTLLHTHINPFHKLSKTPVCNIVNGNTDTDVYKNKTPRVEVSLSIFRFCCDGMGILAATTRGGGGEERRTCGCFQKERLSLPPLPPLPSRRERLSKVRTWGTPIGELGEISGYCGHVFFVGENKKFLSFAQCLTIFGNTTFSLIHA